MKESSVKFSATISKLKEGDWLRWLREISMSLRAQRGWGYVDGSIPAPKANTPELIEWLAAHDQIVGALGTMVEASLQCELESIKDASATWKLLKEKTHSKGLISKLENLMSAIWNRITPDIPASTTITKIKDALGSVFEGGPPSSEDWLMVLLLNALSDGQYDWLRKDLLGFMTNAGMSITSNDIIECIVTEHHEGAKNEEAAMLAKQKRTRKDKSKFCTNCKRRNHNATECWEEGGGNHANAPHWIKKNAGNIGDDKKKGKEANVHVTKDDSSSESAAIAYDLLKPQNMHEERVSITWDDKTPSEE